MYSSSLRLRSIVSIENPQWFPYVAVLTSSCIVTTAARLSWACLPQLVSTTGPDRGKKFQTQDQGIKNQCEGRPSWACQHTLQQFQKSYQSITN